jgi:hypothetical protein
MEHQSRRAGEQESNMNHEQIENAIDKLISQYTWKENDLHSRLQNIRVENGVRRRRGESQEDRADLIKERIELSAQKIQIQQFKADLDSLLDSIPIGAGEQDSE